MGNNALCQSNKQQKSKTSPKNKQQDSSSTQQSSDLKAQNNSNNLQNIQMNTAQHKKFFDSHQSFTMLGISLVIARNNQGKFLAVKENYNQGWWIPGGLVDPPEDFVTAAIRETKEEAGIDIDIKGVLRIEHNFGKNTRYKVVFYGEPKDQNQIPKQIPDAETQEARWVTLAELQELGKQPPYLRGKELLHFGSYLESGGPIYPLSVIEAISVKNFVYQPLLGLQSNTNQNQQVEDQKKQQNEIKGQQNQQQIAKIQNQSQQIPFNITMQKAPQNEMIGLSLIVVRNHEKKFLAVKEARNRGWWLPGGRVDPPEDFITAGKREAKEEAGIDIDIKGILRIEQSYNNHFFRYKIVFYAEPIDEKQKPKSYADSESEEARWVTLNELQELGNHPPYLRGEELVEFGQYLENGGPYYPLDIISTLNIPK